ncbi:hypothetical protein VFC49_09320 [Thermococcus sp. SY098]|uniref:hypothetical protein n=1 Tax=Thermococcus sp. SY098 TaxID=3111325 RepID=UPI002D791992|nr:hypothetical protein [Thermococcus sp. SY098]WRS52245.1 hypothetical protein VFC49_09320 [Thermococcus sp. SY098]
MEFRDYWQEYGAKSYKIDKSKKAKKVFDLERSPLKALDKWLRNPNKYDIKGKNLSVSAFSSYELPSFQQFFFSVFVLFYEILEMLAFFYHSKLFEDNQNVCQDT